MSYTLKVKWEEVVEQEHESLDAAVAAAQSLLAEHPNEVGAWIYGDDKYIYCSVAPRKK